MRWCSGWELHHDAQLQHVAVGPRPEPIISSFEIQIEIEIQAILQFGLDLDKSSSLKSLNLP